MRDIEITSNLGLMHNENEISSAFAEAVHRVIPLAVETEYVKLANAVNKYFSLCKKVEWLNHYVEKNAKDIGKTDKTTEEMATGEEETKAKLLKLTENIAKGGGDSSTYRELMAISEQLYTFAKKKEGSIKRAGNMQEVYTENALDIGDAQIELESSINEINNCLQQVATLDIDGKDRLDGLVVTDKHLDMIDNIPFEHRAEENKTLLKRMLSAYTTMRICAFKDIKKLANMFIETYQKRQLVQDIDSKYSFETELDISTLGLLNANMTSISTLDTDASNAPYETVDNQVSCIELIDDYYTSGTVDREKLYSLISSGNLEIMADCMRPIANTMTSLSAISEQSINR